MTHKPWRALTRLACLFAASLAAASGGTQEASFSGPTPPARWRPGTVEVAVRIRQALHYQESKPLSFGRGTESAKLDWDFELQGRATEECYVAPDLSVAVNLREAPEDRAAIARHGLFLPTTSATQPPLSSSVSYRYRVETRREDEDSTTHSSTAVAGEGRVAWMTAGTVGLSVLSRGLEAHPKVGFTLELDEESTYSQSPAASPTIRSNSTEEARIELALYSAIDDTINLGRVRLNSDNDAEAAAAALLAETELAGIRQALTMFDGKHYLHRIGLEVVQATADEVRLVYRSLGQQLPLFGHRSAALLDRPFDADELTIEIRIAANR